MRQGDIVLVPFPFSDLSSKKTRPALIISNSKLKGQDVILCGITSKKGGSNKISLGDQDLAKGNLPLKSYVCFSKIVSLDKKTIRKVVATVNLKKLQKITSRIINSLKF